ncbi:MAG TPA: FAD-dependent oxidoreductase [Puia sp.]|nr:FAD-dependent oxidoreductase [Puia sp.]
MIRQDFTTTRKLHIETLTADLIIAGGGVSGVCCALTAARAGIRVLLIQDRPVLGGNASSEVRLWILGATSHMGNNNRWAREGGAIDEILVENLYRNPEGNPVIFDTVLLDLVHKEPNIRLLLNTAVCEVQMKEPNVIGHLKAFCSQNQTEYHLHAPLYSDATGDGILGFLSGASFRMGAEPAGEFGEAFAPSEAYGELLGHTLYFYTKDTGRAVRYHAPDFALKDITKIPRFRSFNAQDFGCKLWWIEYGGRLDTVFDTETIKWELWKIVYGVWDHIKNSGKFPEAATMTLEWVGMIPGKRESRRFTGDYMLRQQDIVEQRTHPDAVAYGGWSIDLHPADGIYSPASGCNQWHSKGIYQIPYRCLYSKDIANLFLAGRLISSSHVAFGSSRVMATAASVSQASGMAAVLCHRQGLLPRDLRQGANLLELQLELIRSGQYIPGIQVADGEDLVASATLLASSELSLTALPEDGDWTSLEESMAQLLPVQNGLLPVLEFAVTADRETTLELEFRASQRRGNFTPDLPLGAKTLSLREGHQILRIEMPISLPEPQYVFMLLHRNTAVRVRCSRQRITGLLTVYNSVNPAVSNYGKQEATPGIGMDSFEFWCPRRRPGGQNLALRFPAPLSIFGAHHLAGGIGRPTTGPNAWVADPGDPEPTLTLRWKEPRKIGRIQLSFDTDYDHPMESVLMTHPENVVPFCVRNYRIMDENGELVHHTTGNYRSHNRIIPEQPLLTRELTIVLEHPGPHTPAALFAVRCYEK